MPVAMEEIRSGVSAARANRISGPMGPPLGLQHAWYELARDRQWRSLAIVAPDESAPTGSLARGFGTIAAQDPAMRVLVVNGSVRNTAAEETLALSQDDSRLWQALLENTRVRDGKRPYDYINFSLLTSDQAFRALALLPKLMEDLVQSPWNYHTAIVALDSPVSQTRTIPVLRSVDKVATCLILGSSSIPTTQHLTQIVGREKILGAIALKTRAYPG